MNLVVIQIYWFKQWLENCSDLIDWGSVVVIVLDAILRFSEFWAGDERVNLIDSSYVNLQKIIDLDAP